MRATRFVEQLPEVIPPLFDVTELDPDKMREQVLVVYGASISQDRRTASISFTNGVPDAQPIPTSDLYQLGELQRFSDAWVCGDYRVMQRSSLETSLSALLRISEHDLDLPSRTKKQLGKDALWLTRAAVNISLTTGPVNNFYWDGSVDRRNPDTKIAEHTESYTALLPYLRKPARTYIESKAPESAQIS